MKNKIKKNMQRFLFMCSLLCVVFSPVTDTYCYSEPLEFAVEIHNYENNPEDIQYGNSTVTLKTDTAASPSLVFDLVLSRRVLQNLDTDFIEFSYVAHSEVSGTLTGKVIYYNASNVEVGTYDFKLSNVNTGSFSFAVSSLNRISDPHITRVRMEFTFPSGASRFETLMLSCRAFITDNSGVTDIISAINKQNDLIENGNSDTESAVSDFNSVFEDFNAELDKVEEFDTQILDEFNAANEEYLTQLNDFELSASLLNAGNWLSTSMQTVYDNSSDYKMLWIVPLLLGIPLIILFIKRGDNSE